MSSYETKKENTKSYLLEALVNLLKETPLSQLTVSALTRKAGVSRGTFYLHYLDINDFIKTIEENLFLVIEENLQDDLFYDSGLGKLRYLIAYVEKNYAIFQILIGKNGDKNFEQRLIDLIKQFIVGNIDKNNQHFNIPKDYILDLLTMSVVSIIYTWFDEETPRTSQEIIDIIIKTRFLSPVELVGEKVNV
ncbi:TetR/AcrR family transcriptional regulator [Streptococcus mutans]|uniref:TetR/AcrR family transcriptional regulator n=1 Tax=Streptococcus mutans TaxID=1309 RepID=UPI0002B56EE9|nr:TetR/AcrR family transcriptional regulator [Streptococcus mutans]EMB66064.1 putative transcriptional regulator [Streptococcus mutans 4SM1]